MPVYPEADYKPIKYYDGVRKMAAYYRINHHQAVSTSDSLYGFFNRPKTVCSHFYVDEKGRVEQYVDTKWRAASDLDGNDVTISIETWDDGGKATKWNAAQVKAIIKLDAWLIKTHGIPAVLAKSSKPGENKGLSWHRLGVPYRVLNINKSRRIASAYAPGYLQPGGVWYTTAAAKSCPGDGRIAQIKTVIFDGVKAALSGTSTPVKAPAVKPAPKPSKTPSKPSKTPVKPAGDRVKVDGYWGEELTRRLQGFFGTPVDGEVSGQYEPNKQPALTSGWKWADTVTVPGSKLIWEMQEVLKKDREYTGSVDGIAGPEFFKALQRRFSTPVDGELWKASPVVKAMQRKLNSGKF